MEAPRYTVRQLNEAVGVLLERGFPSRFLLDATVLKPVLKKGHLWLTLTDADASIQAVVWASSLQKLSYRPEDGDGVLVVGKLNFWSARASLNVQVIDLRPSLGTVLRRFEQVRLILDAEGLLDQARKRPLPSYPNCVALLTSVPSSALADLLRTAEQRWPSCRIRVVAIPVQGDVEDQICLVFQQLEQQWHKLGIAAVVLARGGGSREDLTVFDGEQLARSICRCPVPVISAIGHEDDLTIADLVADLRVATPTAALVALLPDRLELGHSLLQVGRHWRRLLQQRLQQLSLQWAPEARKQKLYWVLQRQLAKRHWLLSAQIKLLSALNPARLLRRGYCILRNGDGMVIRDGTKLKQHQELTAQLSKGVLQLSVRAWQPEASELP
jgi:exodeoxyribonuclease VII large subunit